MRHKKPPCATCKMPKLLPENQSVYTLIGEYINLFIDSAGGLSIEGVRLVMDIEKIIVEDKPLFTRKITAYMATGLKIQREKNNG